MLKDFCHRRLGGYCANMTTEKLAIKKVFMKKIAKIKNIFIDAACAVLIAAALSFALFYAVDVGFVEFLGISFPLLVFFLIRFGVCKSSVNYIIICAVFGSSLGVFLLQKYLDSFWVNWDLVDICYVLLIICLVCIFSIAAVAEIIRQSPNNRIIENLFPERRYDLDRIKHMLWRYDTIGINAKWGDGKTYIFNLLEQEMKGKFLFVRVGVLSVTIDSVEMFILNEINHLLEKGRILSSSSSKIRKLLSQPVLYGVGDILFSSDSYTELFKQLKKDVRKLKKIVVITFEDIDRIENKEIVYKIFSIAEMLAGKGIKIIYQYEEKRLLNLLDEKKLYLEKFIPHETLLTQIRFDKIVSIYIQNGKYDNIEKSDFYFLMNEIGAPDAISKRLRLKGRIRLMIPSFSIRKMQLFLDDVNRYVVKKNFKSLKNAKQSIISFFFIKHFCYELYEKISNQENVLETDLFECGNKSYSLKNLLNDQIEEKNIIWDNPNNSLSLTMLILMGFEFAELINDEKKANNVDVKHYRINYGYVFENLAEREVNDSLNRMINHLLAEGKSEYTDYENAVYEMEKRVLHAPESEQVQEYKKLSQDMYEGKFDRDNKTIFKIGIPGMIGLFRAFDIYESSSEEWIKLLTFYFNLTKPQTVNQDLLEVLVCCRLTSRKVYFFILEKYNQLEIIGHLNKFDVYRKFLKKYISAFSSLGFVDSHETNWIEAAGFENISIITEHVFEPLKTKLLHLQNATPNEEMKKNINAMISFIDKNEDVVNCKTAIQEQSDGYVKVNTSTSESDLIKKYEIEFEKNPRSLEKKKEKLLLDYKEEKLKPYEFTELWHHFIKEEPD